MFKQLAYIIHSMIINFNLKKIKVSLSSRIRRRKTFEKYNKVGKRTYINGIVGSYSYIGSDCEIIGTIGRFCSISNHVKTIVASHPIDKISTSPSFYCKSKSNGVSFFKGKKEPCLEKPVVIGNDVWIGENVLIKGGVIIGNGAVIGMGSVVTKDVPPYSVVAGCPARVIKMRFDEKTIKIINESRWWEKDDSFFKNNSDLFLDVASFVKEIRNEK